VPRREGFTLIELTVVVAIAGIVVAFGGLTFSGYFQRSAARRAAQVFAQDLVVARSYAVRSQEPVVLRVFEGTLWYQIVTTNTASEVLRRRFTGSAADVDLSNVALDVSGDTLVFNSRGQIDMSGVGSALGTAAFSAGEVTYEVQFNSLGASRVEES
jgi:prepilin-type N-terminal cleavage/methylation domain-containing protein